MKKAFYLFAFVGLLSASFVSCTYTTEKTGRKKLQTVLSPGRDFIGTFVSEGYEQRTSGADWVSVTITQIRENLFHIEVRSRADIKKPTCTLTTDAQINKKGELYASQSGIDLGFRVSGDSLSIYSPSNNYLGYFCSGGATLTGKYKRIAGEADQQQVDH